MRVNSSVVEAFTVGNILFGRLPLSPLRPLLRRNGGAAGRLTSDVDAAATVFVVDNASAFTAGKVYSIDPDAVKVTARDTTANTISVERAQFGSAAEPYPGPKAITGATNCHVDFNHGDQPLPTENQRKCG